ncbi:response regulator [Puteibacter caeruleilacunae]|nr:response regulator [Puteibacter caeruleilacunae]
MKKIYGLILRLASSFYEYIHPIHFVCFLGILLLLPNSGYAEDYKWTQLSERDGLSQKDVYCITQDQKGFIYLGSDGGVDCYDGYDFRNINTSNGLSSNFIRALYCDSFGNLWIGTLGGGVNIIELKTGIIHTYTHIDNDRTSIADNVVNAIVGDDDGRIWIGTNKGVDIVELKVEEYGDLNFEHFYCDSENSSSLKNIKGVLIDRDKQIWFASFTEGVCRYNPTTKTSTWWNVQNNLLSSKIKVLYEDTHGTIWAGTRDRGLFYLDRRVDRFIQQAYVGENLEPDRENGISAILEDGKGNLIVGTERTGIDVFSLKNRNEGVRATKIDHWEFEEEAYLKNQIRAFYLDDEKNIWVGTFSAGVYKSNIPEDIFTMLFMNPGNSGDLKKNQINAIVEDEKGMCYFGTNDGLMWNNTNTDKWSFFDKQSETARLLAGRVILSILVDSQGVAWLGFDNGELIRARIDNQGKLIALNRYNAVELTSPKSKDGAINSIAVDAKNQLWLGTKGAGLLKAEGYPHSKNLRFVHYPINSTVNGVDGEADISCVRPDETGKLWIGTYNSGFFCFDPKDASLKNHRLEKYGPKQLLSNTVKDIYVGKYGFLWIGTNKGLNKFDKTAESFTTINSQNDVKFGLVKRIVTDRRGFLWVLNGDYISRINPVTERVLTYHLNAGVTDSPIPSGGCMGPKTGIVYLAKENHGFIKAKAYNVKSEEVNLRVYLTDFMLNHKIVAPLDSVNGRVLLHKNINEQGEIELLHTENSFSINFTGIKIGKSQQSFRYKLEGYQDEWQVIGAKYRQATYSGLSHGEYIFKVQIGTGEGVWMDNEASLKINIKPPFWKTNIAYASYVVFILVLMWVIIRALKARLKLYQRLQIERIEKERIEELDQQKTKFFMDVSHELRTPLTMILGSLERMNEIRNTSSPIHDVYRNAKRLHMITNQLLELRKIELNKVRLDKKAYNIVEFTQGVVGFFNPLYRDKGIALETNIENEDLLVDFDLHKIESVLHNLISNAYKFTSKGGRVDVVVRKVLLEDVKSNNGYACLKGADLMGWAAEIQIKDTGSGINSSEIEMIFDRFYQVNNSQLNRVEGFGVGLELVYKCVELHDGQILVKSEPDKGSTFTVRFPLSAKELGEEEKLPALFSPDGMGQTDFVSNEEKSTSEVGIEDQSKPLLLIVEDDVELRKHLTDILKDRFRVIEAVNGEEAMNMVLKQEPDLVITDVMMPVMDGLEFTRIMKNNIVTSHIPVIVLTALSSESERLEGIRNGADSYITKPFNTQYLLSRAQQLLESRTKIYEKVRRDELYQPKELTANDGDEQFLTKAIELVEQKLSDPDYSAVDFVDDMNMSKTVLYKKFALLLGQSPKEFIRTVRIKKAASLLKQESMRISEVAFEVGFNDAQYFSKVFKQQMGCSPKEYVKGERNR